MKIFIVFAHPEEQSFGRALLDAGVTALRDTGHQVEVSDLYRMGFNPVASKDDFRQRRFPHRLQYDREQKHAVAGSGFSADISVELDKLFWCDQLVLQFPLWWFSVPAIMKGWIDRVFVNGRVYGSGLRWEDGGLKGRRACLAMTTGCFPEMVAPDGILGNLDTILWHLHAGVFHYSGLEVLPPFVSHAVRYREHGLAEAAISEYQNYLCHLDVKDPIRFHTADDFDGWRLKAGIKPITVGQQSGPSKV